MSTSRLVPTLAFVTAAGLLALVATSAGCSDSPEPDPAVANELAALRKTMESVGASNEQIARDVRRQDRKINDLSMRLAAAGRSAGHPAAGTASPEADDEGMATAETAEATAAPASEAPSQEVVALLATDEGKQALVAAARGVVAERESRRQDTYVAYSLSKFAEEARLSETQTTDMRRVWDDAMAGARSVMKDAGLRKSLSPEERAQAMEKVRTGMTALAAKRQEGMRAVLDDDQFALYEQRQDEIDAGLHGAPQGRGGPPAAAADARR